MKFTLDRVENGIAVLVSRDDQREQLRAPVSILPPGCMEGDILTVSFDRDIPAADKAKKRISNIIGELWDEQTESS